MKLREQEINLLLEEETEELPEVFFEEPFEKLPVRWFNPDWEEGPSMTEELLVSVIDAQYWRAMSRHNSYRGDVYGHLLSGNGSWYHHPGTRSFLVGQYLDGTVFAISHFAPHSLRDGFAMMADLATDNIHPVVAAVPAYVAGQLQRLGFVTAGLVPQWFNGQLVLKTVCLNKAAVRYTKGVDLTPYLAA